jgi:predicted nucleotidyltransferase
MREKLDNLIEKVKAAAGANLTAAVLYGSAVTGEFEQGHSDLNVLCLVKSAGAAELEKLNSVAVWWNRQGHPAPLVFTLEELRRSADVFAIEMLDIQAHHRVLFGEDFVKALDVPMSLHRLQVERELRTNWLRLRQAVLLSSRKRSALLDLMTASVVSFTTLFRHALIALGENPPEGRRAVVDRMAVLVGGDAAGFHAVLDLRAGKLKPGEVDVQSALRAYLEFVERVTDEVDRRFEAKQ